MRKNRNVEENERGRKPMPEWQKWVLAYTVTGFVIWWVSTMPMRFYEPYCGLWPEEWRGEHYGAHLSTSYRGSLVSGLQGRDIPYIEIGDRVLVPLVDPGYLNERKNGLERLFYIVFKDTDRSWSLTHVKVASDAIFGYATDHPESDIAKLREKYFSHLHGGAALSSEERNALRCEMTKRIVDPNLN